MDNDIRRTVEEHWRNSRRLNRWFMYEHFVSVYIRIERRLIDDTFSWFVVIANISMPECVQRKGLFTRLVDRELIGLPLYIENVLNPEWCEALKRHGWKETEVGSITCLYRGL